MSYCRAIIGSVLHGLLLQGCLDPCEGDISREGKEDVVRRKIGRKEKRRGEERKKDKSIASGRNGVPMSVQSRCYQ